MHKLKALSDSGLPPVHRVVTGHDCNGRSVVKLEYAEPTRMIAHGDAATLLIWTTPTVPADNNDERDGRESDTVLTIDQGSVLRIIDMLPGKQSPMHRTNSVDYGIVLEGEVELELDDGSKTIVAAGGVIVQRGTNHLWRNTTTKPVRIAFVLIEAGPYIHDGVPLPENKA